MRSTLVVLLLMATLTAKLTLAVHTDVGMPPQFNSVQDDVVVFETNADGSKADLVLDCDVTGMPTPIVTWYRGDEQLNSTLYVLDNGTFVYPNITEGVFASRAGVDYHCEASNILGATGYTATIRSRDITVYYANFAGFDTENEGDVFIPTTNGIDFAVECKVQPGSQPEPMIEWFEASAPDTPLMELTEQNDLRYLEGGRFLYVRNVNSFPREYYCAVSNAFLHTQVVSGTRYMLNGTGLMAGMNHVYKEIGERTAFVGDEFEFSYVATVGLNDQDCNFEINGIEQSDLGAVGTDDVLDFPPGNVQLRCVNNGQTVGDTGTLTIYARAAITNPPDSNREVIVGREQDVTFSCANTGSPTPSLDWYFNGELIGSSTPGVSISDATLTIAAPQVSHSGMYQCFIESEVDGNRISESSASWLLEVREPVVPAAMDFDLDAIGAVEDRQVGALIVKDPESMVTVSVMVVADPCPTTFQWTFNGTNINNGEDYDIPNPCSDTAPSSPFTYTLTVRNLTAANSGPYTATFMNLEGTGTLPGLYITIPEPVENPVPEPVSLAVVDDPIAQCFLNASNVTITCNTAGFPRPGVMFTRDGILITPGASVFSKYEQTFADQILIPNVDSTDDGVYRCQTNETVPIVSPQSTLEFCTRPVLINSAITENIFEGERLTIECQFGGEPEPVVRWTKDGSLLTATDDIEIVSVTLQDQEEISRVVINMATLGNAGSYVCEGSNDAGSVSKMFTVEVQSSQFGPLTLPQIIGIAAGGAGLILLIVLVILLLCCVYMCARNSKKGGMDLPYNVSSGGKMYTDYSADPRGNVDKDSDEEDGGQPEAFSPEYESLPALRPAQPPMYKPTPSYPHGAPMHGDDMEMVKVPPPDTDSFVGGAPPYRRDNGVPDYRPSPDDFLSEDAQFV